MVKHVLSVDDSPSMRMIIKSCLEKEGYQVTEACDGLDGLEKLKQGNEFNLLIVDFNMPNMDGISFVKEVRKLQTYNKIPIVMLTTESEALKKAEGARSGATGWITKPFDPEEFIKVVGRLTK
ncbi:MAG: response regulator [Spirochaetota bacterium]|nr:response regulator [Spirochaetota bacterium]